ncbi:MAG: isopeptide-forming domain-containing fimbrial protein, partial [Patulibacter sp.]
MRPRSVAIVRLWGLVLALLAGLAFGGTAAATAADPVLQLQDGTPTQVLYGSTVPVELTASLPTGSAKGYNLAYRVVLPAGTTYVAGSAGKDDGDPRQLVDPLTGRTTLIWPNVDDLVANASHTLAFRVRYGTTDDAPAVHYDVAEQLTIESGAFISANARDEADFSATGEPIGPRSGSFSARADRIRVVDLSAIEIEKSEPHPEGEIPRGLHNHQTVYTLKVRNNSVNPTTGITVEDFVPAGLEFLGCATQVDNTTNTTTNPGSAQEYPGSGPIVVTAPTTADGCIVPDHVETVRLDPDGDGPLPLAVYTHVRWNLNADLVKSGTTTLRYAAAIPLRENTLDWTGTTPGLTGQQTANLDNNSGPETYDEQLLRNGARAAGDYRSPGKPARPSFDWDVLDRTAEDIAIQKSNNKASLEQDDLTKWTIDLQVSEYRSLNDVVITDTVPDGLCPLGPGNYERTGAGLPAAKAECAPQAGHLPSKPFTDVTEQADGTYAVTWDKTTFPDLAHLKPSETRQLTFWTRTRENYQQNFDDATPVLSMDSVENNVAVQGLDWVRCSSNPNDCTNSGTKIWHQETDGELDFDVSKSGKAASGPVLVKEVAAVFPGDGQCSNLAAAQYGKTVPVYGPGDQVCWKLRIEFPSALDTRSQDVFDLLPNGLQYVANSAQPTAANTVNIAEVDGSVESRVRWRIGNGDLVDRGNQVFEVTFQSTVGSVEGHSSGDVEGNLLKFSYENTAGTAFTLRDRTDFALKLPQLSLLKGVRQINGTGPVNGPNVDNQRVHEGDKVEYRIDVSNVGAAAVQQGHVWDVLPVGITCAQVDLASISDAGTCNTLTNRIQWTTVALAAGTPTTPATKTLTYKVTMPDGISPDTNFINTAGVIKATYVANDGTPFVVVPNNPLVKDPALTPNAPKAEDPSNVRTPAAAVVKARTTSVNESGNNAASQATIGETVKYTVTTTIPAGTTLYGTPTVVDALGARQTYVPGTLSGTLNGVDLPTAGISAAVAGNTVTATFPTTFKTGAQDAVLVLKFDVTVLDVAANVRGAALPNEGVLSYKTPTNASKTLKGSVSTTIVEPKVATTKTHTPSGRISPGQLVDFTVTARNTTGTNVSTAHDAVVVDTLPAGTDPVDASGNPLADGATVPSNGGVWNATARTITWTKAATPALATLAPGASTELKYRVRLENPATAGTTYTNTVDLQVRSLDGTVSGIRTSGSTSTTAPDYKATASDVISVVLPAITKAVTPTTGTIGTPVTWTVTVTLPKDVRYFDTTVVDTVPDGFDVDRYASMSCTSGCVGNEPTPSSFPVTDAGSGTLQAAWFLGDIAPHSSERVYTLVVEGHIRDTYRNAPQAKVLDGTNLTNQARVRTNRTDVLPAAPPSVPSSFSDTVGPATATVKVVEPKLTLTKAANKTGYVEGGEQLTYTVTLKNTGTSPAYDVVVRDAPDVELTNVQLASGVSTSLNTKPWSAGDRVLEWKIPGPVAVNETVTFTYTADVKAARDLTAGDVVENIADIDEYWGRTKLQRDTNPWTHRRYTGPSSKVQLTVVKPNLTIAKTPDAGQPAAKAVAGTDSSFKITVKNTDTRATARNVVVQDELPAGLSYTAGTATANPSTGFSETSASGQAISWKIASLGPNQSVTITLPVHVASSVLNGTTLTNVATTNADEVPEEKSDTGVLEVEAKADLQVTKTAGPSPVIPGQNITFTLKTKNNGPSDANASKLQDTLPAYLTLVSLSDTTACAAVAQVINCDYGTLKPGDERVLLVVAKVDPARTTPVVNAVAVTTTTPDPKPENNEDDVTVPVDPKVDVSIAKTADGGVVQGGQTVTYTLRAHNQGPSTARGVAISDAVPSDLTIVSATLLGTPNVPCAVVGQQVDCAVGALAPGADATVKIVTTAKGTAPAPKG